MTILAFHSPAHDAKPWQDAVAKTMPEVKFLPLDQAADIDEESYAVVLYHPYGSLARLPRLQAILSIAAGVDHLINDPALPNVPIYRQTDTSLQQTMVEYAMMAVLMQHRDMPDYIEQQQRQCYDMHLPLILAQERKVAVLGLGNLGREIAAGLQRMGFRTLGWSRTSKDLPNIQCFHGDDGLREMLSQSEILVNVLPLTRELSQMINADFLAQMPRGAKIVNIGRGGHVHEADLLEALDSGQIASAILDVQNIEPLPENDPLWRHPKVVLTPHIAGDILMKTAIPGTLENLRLLIKGGQPKGLYRPSLGY